MVFKIIKKTSCLFNVSIAAIFITSCSLPLAEHEAMLANNNADNSAVESMAYLAPELKPLMQSPDHLIELLGFHHITKDNLKDFREKERLKPYRPKVDVKVEKIAIKGKAEQPEVDVYLINADQTIKRPAILYMHGGGYVLGKAADSVVGLQSLAKEHDCVIVSVDYRLAPETPFPGALEDNYAALKWLYNNADELGVDKQRIVVMGKSAGGGHAAMLAIAARDRGEVPIKQQILIYPMLDDRTGSSRKVAPWIGQFLWTETSNQFGWSSLLGKPAGSKQVPYGAVPARVQNLQGLPPAFIQVGAIDLFVEENIDYAKRLIQAGVATELAVAPGMFHAAENVFRDSEVAQQFKVVTNNAISNALQN